MLDECTKQILAARGSSGPSAWKVEKGLLSTLIATQSARHDTSSFSTTIIPTLTCTLQHRITSLSSDTLNFPIAQPLLAPCSHTATTPQGLEDSSCQSSQPSLVADCHPRSWSEYMCDCLLSIRNSLLTGFTLADSSFRIHWRTSFYFASQSMATGRNAGSPSSRRGSTSQTIGSVSRQKRLLRCLELSRKLAICCVR